MLWTNSRARRVTKSTGCFVYRCSSPRTATSTYEGCRGRPFVHRWIDSLRLLSGPRTATPKTADSLKNLPTIVVYGAQEYPPLEAEGAVALCLFGVSVVSFAGCGVETVAGGRYPYLVHSGHPFFCGPRPRGVAASARPFLVYADILPFDHHLATL